jgi:hypothetical protein
MFFGVLERADNAGPAAAASSGASAGWAKIQPVMRRCDPMELRMTCDIRRGSSKHKRGRKGPFPTQ